MRDPIQISSLGFGCAPIMGKIGKAQALRSMSEAFDLGVTHYDVARSYGFGQAERLIGGFIQGRRDKITITSKFGIVPPELSLPKKALIPIARTAVSLFPQLQQKLKNKSGQLLAERRYNALYAEQCLNKSLTELATDYIDIYLIHEPDITVLQNKDELIEFLEHNVRAGKIRRWGLAVGSPEDYSWAKSIDGDIIQFEVNVNTLPFSQDILTDKKQRIVTRPFSGGLNGRTTLDIIIKKLALTDELNALNASIADVSLCLANNIAGSTGSILCSMFSANHIRSNIQAIEHLSTSVQMKQIIDCILKELIPNNTLNKHL